jgi:hypothetical protein
MARLSGTKVILYDEVQIGSNPLGEPIYKEEPVEVENVLIGEPSTDDITTSTELYGKSIRYMLGIPKGDTHDWKDKKVSWTDAYGITHTVKTFGFPMTGIEQNLPPQIPWHMKVRCEDYE